METFLWLIFAVFRALMGPAGAGLLYLGIIGLVFNAHSRPDENQKVSLWAWQCLSIVILVFLIRFGGILYFNPPVPENYDAAFAVLPKPLEALARVWMLDGATLSPFQ